MEFIAMEENENMMVQGVHKSSAAERYVAPKEDILKERLEWFQDQKLGFMMHWGPYSQIGMDASWSLVDEDSVWSQKDIDWTADMNAYRKQYFGLNRTFNPIRFEPQKIAGFAADAGFKYLIFTTKHHDGFCMWDTAYTGYKITAPDCPFHTNPRADIVRELFDAFRARNMAIGAYFSKADWHTPYFWNPEFPHNRGITTRNASYNPAEHPELWDGFKAFTKNQILELCRNYGRIDILWFDAGWIRAPQQDIDLGGIVDAARKLQPWLIAADRTVGGPYENYLTPEQEVPDEPPGIPWESNLTMSPTSWGFRYNETYKSPREIMVLLANTVAFGGNLVLNIGPQPDGRLPAEPVRIVKILGAWLKVNGEAIYGTRACAPYKAGNLRFTKKGGTVYVIRLYEENEQAGVKEEIPWNGAVHRVRLLENGESLAFTRGNNTVSVTLPDHVVRESAPLARVFALQ
jgi:alpha-L-fucosidase